MVKFVAIVSLALLSMTGCLAVSGDIDTPVEEVAPPPPPPPAPPEPVVVDPEPPGLDLTLYSIDEAESLWVVVNKLRPLNPIDFAPSDLVAPNVPAAFDPLVRREVAEALEKMYAEAVDAGVPFRIQSSYRSYGVQQRVKANSVSRLGSELSDQRSARPGHSEHQTGLAVDLTTPSGACTLEACFATTPEGEWLAGNAWRFGFILRYLEGKTDIHGYVFEPWHFRYVGPELAEEVHRLGYPTLEELFGLEPAPDYAAPPPAPTPPPDQESERLPGRDEVGNPDFPDDPE